jgi:SAM-dependent methyltransferase
VDHSIAEDAAALAGALGRIDGMVLADSWGAVDGWILHPDYPLDSVRVSLNGTLLGEATIKPRPDVGDVVRGIAHGAQCGFLAQGPALGLNGRSVHIETVGLANGNPVVRAEDFWPGDDLPAVPEPDAELMRRVSLSSDAATFRRTGYCIAAQMLREVRRQLPGVAAPRVLDWGCGSGRATRFLPILWPALRIAGCDIDAEAVAWCAANLPGMAFDATAPYPPLPYQDGAFDAVLAASVLTHLAAPLQRQWLHEIRRVLAPGGVLVASALGRLSVQSHSADERAAFDASGIRDTSPDTTLDGVAPPGYYRSTFQNEAFTRAHWGAVLPVVAYRLGGLTNFQDLVVLRA